LTSAAHKLASCADTSFRTGLALVVTKRSALGTAPASLVAHCTFGLEFALVAAHILARWADPLLVDARTSLGPYLALAFAVVFAFLAVKLAVLAYCTFLLLLAGIAAWFLAFRAGPLLFFACSTLPELRTAALTFLL